MLDPRLKAVLLGNVNISYGGENGFNQAIELSSEILTNVTYIHEKRIIGRFFEEISKDSGKFIFSVNDIMQCLEMGAVDTVIVWDNLNYNRYELRNMLNGGKVVRLLNSECAALTNMNIEVFYKIPLIEWLVNNYKQFGCALEIITNNSQEGSQFCRGFGGIGGILRYPVDIRSLDLDENNDTYDEDF